MNFKINYGSVSVEFVIQEVPFKLKQKERERKGYIRNVSCTGIARCRLILIRCEKY